ncbi:protein INCA1 isoform X1 [Mauremys mutica]|nr:protein INCA1 isoform X1 [Mauremys mutica]XP_044856399.1 protein INCA1 isoform X1 [Mauremys mutica]XP_044856400.1 protein INCA1 isoform X1 [Mauremys mutica]XP_044856401.1 protein INCA1 isoform X1 [Mauremys mutica]
MEEETCTPLVPFATQSKVVSRDEPNADATELPTRQRGPSDNADGFWSGLSQRPSPPWMEEYREASPLLRSSSAVRRPDAQTDAGSWPALAIPQALPSPRELCRRRSGRLKRRRPANGSVMSVCYHLEDLKKRQSSIDQLKRLKWGGYGSPASSEGLEGAAVSLAEELQSGRDLLSRLTKPRPSWLWEEDSFVSCSGSGQRSCSPGEQPGIPEGRRGGSSLVATADRPQPPGRCLPQEAFWGFRYQPEE